MNVRKLGAAGLVSALIIGLTGLAATSAAAEDTPYAEITGTVTYKSKPVAGASIYAQGTKGEWGVGTTDASGSYTIGWLDPGTYTVYVSDSKFTADTFTDLAFLQTYAGGTVRQPDAAKYTVTAGGTRTVDIKAIAGATVKGKVVDSKNRPVKGVTVSGYNTTRAGNASTTTDSKGRYVLKGLATGKVEVSASTAKAAGRSSVTAKQNATRSAKTIKLKNHALGTITGTVKGLKTGDAISLYDTRAKYSLQIAVADKKTVKIKHKVAPGTYRLVVNGTNTASKAVTVRNKKTAKAGTLRAPKKRTKVSGTIKGSNGKRLARAGVWVEDKYGTNAGFSETNAKGKYSVTGVVSGSYTLSVHDGTAKNAATTAKVKVKKGKNAKKSIKLSKGYRVKGTVKYNGKAVAGVDIGGSRSFVTTNSKGKFTLKGLGKGKHRLSAYDPYPGGYLNRAKNVTVKSKNLKWNVSVKK